MGKTSESRTIGLSIHDRISKEGLEFIKEHDPDLYADIQKRKNPTKKKRGIRESDF